MYSKLFSKQPQNKNMLKVCSIKTREQCETCMLMVLMTFGQRHYRCSGAFIVKFEEILNLFQF